MEVGEAGCVVDRCSYVGRVGPENCGGSTRRGVWGVEHGLQVARKVESGGGRGWDQVGGGLVVWVSRGRLYEYIDPGGVAGG